MHLFSEAMVPVDFGVNNAKVLRVSLLSVTSLMMPVPMAVNESVSWCLSLYVVMGIGLGRSWYSHKMAQLLVALQLAPVSACMALLPRRVI